MATIKVTPEELTQQGDDLIGFAGELSDILGKVEQKITAIDAGWDGLAQDGYVAMYQELKPSLDKFPELVDTLGNAAKSAAEAFSSVDDQLKAGFSV